MTDEEKTRLAELDISYKNEGVFPEGEIKLLDSREAYKGKGVGYYAATGTFYFPEDDLSDEELLQIIDFRHKRDYSIGQINSMIASGELSEEQILNDADNNDKAIVPVFTEQETIIPYTGDLSITAAAAGGDCIYLAGYNEIHKTGIEESSSEVFYDDFDADTWIKYMYQAQDGLLYVAVSEKQESGIYAAGILVLDGNANPVRKIDLSEYYEDTEAMSYIFRMAVDNEGYIYMQGINIGADSKLMVLNPEGKKVSVIDPNTTVKSDEGKFVTDPRSGMCVGKDGKVYVWFTQGSKKGMASVNRDNGTLEDIYYIDYDGELYEMDVIGTGNNSDFILWGYDGMYTWSVGDERAECVYKSYDKDYRLDGSIRCTTGDGRILVIDCTEVKEEAKPERGQFYLRIPEKTVFYYEADVE